MSKREEILRIVEESNLEEFVKFIRTCKSDGSDLAEIISGCSKKQFEKLWEGTQQTCATTLLDLQIGDEQQEDNDNLEEEFQKITDVLDCVVYLASSTIHQTELYVPPCLLSTAIVLHGLLLPIPEKADKLKNSIAHLFEEWWTKGLPGKDDLMTNTFIYLLQRSLNTKTLKDVKRVWSLHEVLLAVDMSNESSQLLKDLIQKCMVSFNYLKADEGLRFLGFVMSLDLQLTESLHKTIKNHLPSTSKSWLEKYGEIYFRGWQKSSGNQLEKIETFCIQDLMYHAVHAGKSLASSLRKVLSYFHHQKKQKGVDDMILKLYDPILWRSLKVANARVRSNAVSLLIDAFPLQSTVSGLEETDQLLQKQFDVLQTLLEDPCPVVRSVTVLGLFKIMSMYWEMIPPNTIKNITSKMIQELIWDATSADVRESVIKGLTLLLDNHLSHALLKPVLPEVCNFIHDTSEKVRVAMMNLLLKVKGMRTIKFWNIVPVEHLLARLEIDSPPVARRVVKLLFSSFMPLHKSSEAQINRCVTLIQTNAGASRQFFHNATRHMSLQETCSYITLICRCILECIKMEKETCEGNENGEDEENQGEKSKVAESDDLTVHNVKVMVGLIEAIVILWTSSSEEFKKTENAEFHKNLQRKISLALPEMFRTFEDPQIYTALILLAGHIQSNSIPSVSRSCLSKLRNMSEDNSTEDYGCLLEAICNWGKADEVFDLVDEWLQESLNAAKKDTEPKSTKSGKKSRKSVGFVDLKKPQPGLGVQYITYMMKHPVCCTILLTDHQDKLVHIRDTLKLVMDCVECKDGNIQTQTCEDTLLIDMFTLYCKVIIILHNKDDEENSTIQIFEQILTWADTNLIPVLRQEEDADVQSGKRSLNEISKCSLELAAELIKVLLSICSHMMLLGIGDVEFTTQITDFCIQCLQSDESLLTLPDVLSCLYQVTEYLLLCENETDDGIGSHGNTVPGFLAKVLVSMATYVKRKKDHSVKLLTSVKGPVAEILSAIFRSLSLEPTVLQDVMATLLAAVLAELSNSSTKRELEECCKNFTDLPILSCWLCEIVCKKISIAKHFVKELCKCIESGAASDVHNLNSAVSLLGAFSHGKLNVPGLKDCWTAIHTQFERLKQSDRDFTEGEIENDVMKDIESTLKDCQQKLNMVPT